jgi:hypothetical protein
MHDYGSLPRAREDGLLEEMLGEELLLYDQNSHTAHCLSPIAARVWRHCDGGRDVTKLAQLAGADASLVTEALHELRERELVEAEPALMQSESAVSGVSRREAVVRVARYGAAAAVGPMIVSAAAATPAMASSCGGKEGRIEIEPSEIVAVKFAGEVSHVITVHCFSGEVEGPTNEFSSAPFQFEITNSKCAGKLLKSGESCQVTIKHIGTAKGQNGVFWYEWKNGVCTEKAKAFLESV